MRRLARELVQTVVLAALMFGLLQCVVQMFRVEQRSMEPTLHEGQYLVVDKLSYLDLGRFLDSLLTGHASAAEAGPTSHGVFGPPSAATSSSSTTRPTPAST